MAKQDYVCRKSQYSHKQQKMQLLHTKPFSPLENLENQHKSMTGFPLDFLSRWQK
jgi:hypothetical protein